jgi:hypothetical protein
MVILALQYATAFCAASTAMFLKHSRAVPRGISPRTGADAKPRAAASVT